MAEVIRISPKEVKIKGTEMLEEEKITAPE